MRIQIGGSVVPAWLGRARARICRTDEVVQMWAIHESLPDPRVVKQRSELQGAHQLHRMPAMLVLG